MIKKPIYITINDKQPLDHTNEYDGYIIDFDKRGRTIGIEILDYKKILINGTNLNQYTSYSMPIFVEVFDA